MLAGSNAAWAHPVLYQRMQASARPGRRVVVIDPRKTATSDLADLHLAIRPGTDTVLFNGLLVWLADQQAVDHGYLADHCEGFDASLSAAESAAPSPEAVSRICELPVEDVITFYRWFAEEQRTVTAFSQGINQSSAGTDKGNAIINCHLATGRVGKPGASPFSLTGQPNAMGGREVGGLANTLNEIAQQSKVGIHLSEADIPLKPQVAAACEFLGLDPLYVANEGKLIAICSADIADQLLSVMRQHPAGQDAAIVGTVVEDDQCFVEMTTRFGGQRMVDWLNGEQLPRIC